MNTPGKRHFGRRAGGWLGITSCPSASSDLSCLQLLYPSSLSPAWQAEGGFPAHPPATCTTSSHLLTTTYYHAFCAAHFRLRVGMDDSSRRGCMPAACIGSRPVCCVNASSLPARHLCVCGCCSCVGQHEKHGLAWHASKQRHNVSISV